MSPTYSLWELALPFAACLGLIAATCLVLWVLFRPNEAQRGPAPRIYVTLSLGCDWWLAGWRERVGGRWSGFFVALGPIAIYADWTERLFPNIYADMEAER